MVSRGKSSVLNALVGQEVFKVGATHGTTVVRAAQRWEQSTLGRPGLEGARLVVVDTPGIDEVGGEVREVLARDVARHADLILFVVSGDMQRVEIEALAELREAQKPIILVFNQIDRYPELDRDQIYANKELYTSDVKLGTEHRLAVVSSAIDPRQRYGGLSKFESDIFDKLNQKLCKV